MKTRKLRSGTALKLAVASLSVLAISCTLAREFGVGGYESEKTRRLHEKLPAGMTSAFSDHDIYKPWAFRVILPEPGKILIGDADAEPIDAASLDQQLKSLYSSATPDRRVVFLLAAVDAPNSEVAAVLDMIRENDLQTVRLATGSPFLKEERGFFDRVLPPENSIEVMVRKEKMAYKPNPLLLLVTTGPDGRPTLNNEPSKDLAALTTRLSEIFKQREYNGVFREGTNEVEKTVLVDIPRDGANQMYGDLVKMIDAIKNAGAQPVVLGDKNKFMQLMPMPEFLTSVRDLPKQLKVEPPDAIDPDKKVVPRSISGGVLNGKATSLPKPPYPPAARAVRASGPVTVQVTVDTDGRVIEASAVSGHPLLRPAAVTAARSARFSPTLISGKPVQVTGVLVYNFTPESQ